MAPELLAELGEPYQKLWKMLDSRYGALETARLFAKLLGSGVLAIVSILFVIPGVSSRLAAQGVLPAREHQEGSN